MRIRITDMDPTFNFDADPGPACHFDADQDTDSSFRFDADLDPTFRFDADPDLDPSFQMKAQNLEKMLKYAHIPYILPCHLQIDADPDPYPQHWTKEQVLLVSWNLPWSWRIKR